MAAPFVPVSYPVDWTGASRSWTKTGSPVYTSVSSISFEPSPPEGIDDSWSRPRGAMLDGSATPLHSEGSFGHCWVEIPFTPTLLGYDILEERAKFTVYKILVTGRQGDSWVIFRRYADFLKLSDKLKELFPSFGLALPPKRWFKNNYDEKFLEERKIGLQMFLERLTLHEEIISSDAIRRFLCLVDVPCPFDSLEESRAFCETLEETNHRLQRELLENQKEVDTLKKTLEEKENHISLLVKKIKSLSLSSESFTIATDIDTQTEGNTDVNGFEQEHTQGNEGAEDDGGYCLTEVDKESKYEKR